VNVGESDLSWQYRINCNTITGKMEQEVAHSGGGCNSRHALNVTGEITSLVHIDVGDRSLVL
jgi:hypothetical protein